MTEAGLLGNIAAHSLQVACLAVLGAALARLLPVDVAAVRYGWWRALLGLCLVLPWLQGRHTLNAAADAGTGSTIVSFAITTLVTPGAPPPAQGISWPALVLLALAGGSLLRLVWILASCRTLRRLRTAGSAVLADGAAEELQRLVGARAEIRYVPELAHPVTFGALRPVILLPDIVRTQAPGIGRAVLCHELLHVRRRDWAWLLAEELVRAALWFNPAIWWLVSRVQLAREEAVDEQAVLITGGRRTYMRALLAFAGRPALSPAAAFGRRHHLFRRMVLISKEAAMSSRRIVLSCAVMAAAVAAGGWLAVGAFPLAGAASPQDAGSGAGPLERQAKPITPENPVPRRIHSVPASYPTEALASGVRAVVTLRLTLDGSGRVAEARRIDGYLAAASVDPAARRRYEEAFARSAVESVRRWQYEPPAEAPLSFTTTFAFQPDSDARLVSHDAVPPKPAPGTPPATVPPAPWHDGAVRIGGAVKPPVKIKDVRPAYPPEAEAAGIEGLVILEARVEPDGKVSHTRVLRSVPALDEAALESVRQWEFAPTLVNGEAVPIVMVVTIQFTLANGG